MYFVFRQDIAHGLASLDIDAVSYTHLTGGGSGLPFSSELPNGWSVRFSASPMYEGCFRSSAPLDKIRLFWSFIVP